MTIITRPWQIAIPTSQMDTLRGQVRFQRLLTLAQIVNSIRFAQSAAVDRRGDDSPASDRQRAESVFYLAGVLDEGLNFAERLGEHFRDLPAYKGIVAVLKGAASLRAGLLDRLRNQAVYHKNDECAQTGLARMRSAEYVFAASNSRQAGDVYYQLADHAFFAFMLDAEVTDFRPAFSDAISQVVTLANDFARASDRMIAEELQRLGFRPEEVDSAGCTSDK